MKFTPTALPGVVIVDPDVHGDPRGFFLETWHARKYKEGGIDAAFVQDNLSRSGRRTLRGLHAQLRRPQGKLVRVVEGAVFDVAVDIRRGSPHFGKWVGVELSAADQRQLYVPEGFAHGFCVLSESAQFEYKCTDFYDPEDEIAILWNDPDIGIEWPIDDPTLSKRDVAARRLRDFDEGELPVFEPGA
ncbi:MAG: dTDP-4-dehydrorhamnose 3,5-epimerase [Myxococcota bacterium]